MKIVASCRHALSVSVAAAILVSCGGSQPPTGASGAMPQSHAITTHAERDRSWMLPEAAGRNLLYVSSGGVVNVYSYPRGTLLGSLGSFNVAEGLCADKSGHIFVTSFYDHLVFEYNHGGTMPIATLRSPYTAFACSVDPKTGDVAVSSGYGVAVFPYNRKHGYRLAKAYYDSAVYYPMFCGYDNRGDLFVDGTSYLNFGFAMSELARGGSSFTSITLNHKIGSPGMVQWDGRYLAVGDTAKSQGEIRRFAINGSTGTLVGSAILGGSSSYAQFWIERHRIIGPETGSNGGIALWNYPKGGSPVNSFSGSSPFSATVSLK